MVSLCNGYDRPCRPNEGLVRKGSLVSKRKLTELKRWLTVNDAASHLADVLDEDVTVADVLQLALEGRLTLSVRFLSPVTGVQLTAGWRYVRDGEDSADREPEEIPEDPFVELPNDVYDLPLTGVERRDVEDEYQRLCGVKSLWTV